MSNKLDLIVYNRKNVEVISKKICLYANLRLKLIILNKYQHTNTHKDKYMQANVLVKQNLK